MQETFLRLHRSVHAFQSNQGHRFHTLVIVAARRAALDFRKKEHADMRDKRLTVSGDKSVRGVENHEQEGVSLMEHEMGRVALERAAALEAELDMIDHALGCLDEALAAERKRGRSTKTEALREAFLDWLWSRSTDEEIGRRHGMTPSQFKYFREKMAKRLAGGWKDATID